MRCTSSVRPSSLTFHIFDFFSETSERNSTKLDKKQDLNVLYQVCVFRSEQKNKMALLASDWLRHFDFYSQITEQNSTKIDMKQISTKFVFSGPIGKTRWSSRPLISRDILTSSLKQLNGIRRNLRGSKIFMSFHVIYQVCVILLVGWLVALRMYVALAVFQPYRDLEAGDNQSLKIQVARPGIEPRTSCSASQELINSTTAAPLWFSDRSEKQDCHPGLWLAEKF